MKSKRIESKVIAAALLFALLQGCQADTSADDAASATDTAAVAATDVGAAPEAMPTPAPAATMQSAMANPNSTTASELTSIPGVTQPIADAIVAGRPYANMVALDKVLSPKLSEKARDSVYARLWMPIDLNKATGAEIMLIPGVGARMRHEFEEYRPYTSIERFRREIGKYVDSTEIARLERYVTVK